MRPTFERLRAAALVLVAVVAVVAVALPGAARAQGLSQWVSPGPLAADHADLEGLTQCTKCHAPLLGVTMDRCVACHDNVGDQVRKKTGFHANKGDRCGSCHPDHKGRSFHLARVELSPVEHLKETGFPLDGAHEQIECTECHTAGDWANVEPECASCHDTPHGRAEHVVLDACDDCHGTRSWDVRSIEATIFDHLDPKQTDYVLEGAHVDVACVDCHINAKFVPIKFDTCTSCHADPHSARFTAGCTSCHTVETWIVSDFDHDTTGYPLEGLHARVVCEKCHRGGDFSRPIKHETCSDCHKDIHRAQFAPRACDTCHTVTEAAFKIKAYDHSKTQYPLEGKHQEVACADCHGAGPAATYVPVEHTDCDACHDDVHEGKFEPTPCSTCHPQPGTGWAVGEFDHDRTDFPLRGEHMDVECATCHPNDQWSGIAHETCDLCHDDHPHAGIFEPSTCAECHVETGWAVVTFAHAEQTEFDLQPQHSRLACKECHLDMAAFAGLDTGCRDCHADDTPAGHYDGACDGCHRTSGWLPADLGGQPHDVTGYPLVGTHSRLACEDCHGSNRTPLSAAGADCVECHDDDDAHRNLLGPLCDDCHTPITWQRTSFRHALTGWPLRGAHRIADCDDCHAASYVSTPSDCWRCHEVEAPKSVPAHRSAFFLQCDTCHRPYTWGVIPNALFGAGTAPTTPTTPGTGQRR